MDDTITLDWGGAPCGFQVSQRLESYLEQGIVKFPEAEPAWRPGQTEDERQRELRSLRDKAVKSQGASVELRLGDEYYVTDMKLPAYLSDGSDTLTIPGGQFALLTTFEKVRIPKDGLALISVKSSSKQKGLINISGFHIDPGFTGRIHYAVFNVGPGDIVLRRRQYLFQMFLVKLEEDAKQFYDGAHDKQDHLSTDLVALLKGKPLSLDTLEKQINSLEVQLRILMTLFVGLVAAVVVKWIVG